MRSVGANRIGEERPVRLTGDTLFRYEFASKFVKNKTVLDIGCGLGLGSNFLAKHGAKSVLGIDNSLKAINYAKTKFVGSNIKFMRWNALQLNELKTEYDVVVALEVIEHLPNDSYAKFIKQIAKVLKKKGICILSTPNKLTSSPNTKKPSNPYHTREFEPQELTKLFNLYTKRNLYGLLCTNKNYLKYRNLSAKTLRKKLITYICSFKFIHLLLPYIPTGFKSIVTDKNNMPILTNSDFVVSRININKAEGLIMVSQK